jgi:hypothetical protein
LSGADTDPKDAPFERLRVAAGKGYSLAMAWPDGGMDDPILSFSQAARDSIKRFTHTLTCLWPICAGFMLSAFRHAANKLTQHGGKVFPIGLCMSCHLAAVLPLL